MKQFGSIWDLWVSWIFNTGFIFNFEATVCKCLFYTLGCAGRSYSRSFPLGKWSSFDVHIFQMGWFNQQLLVDSFLDASRIPFLLEFFPVTAWELHWLNDFWVAWHQEAEFEWQFLSAWGETTSHQLAKDSPNFDTASRRAMSFFKYRCLGNFPNCEFTLDGRYWMNRSVSKPPNWKGSMPSFGETNSWSNATVGAI